VGASVAGPMSDPLAADLTSDTVPKAGRQHPTTGSFFPESRLLCNLQHARIQQFMTLFLVVARALQ
jgi:hypothetical protein